MVTTLRRPAPQAQRLAVVLEEALVERQALALTLGHAWEASMPGTRTIAALHASTARVDALVLQLELLELPAVRLN